MPLHGSADKTGNLDASLLKCMLLDCAKKPEALVKTQGAGMQSPHTDPKPQCHPPGSGMVLENK